MLLSQHPPKMGWSGAVVSCCWYKKQLPSPPPVRTASNISDVAQLVYRLDWIGFDYRICVVEEELQIRRLPKPSTIAIKDNKQQSMIGSNLLASFQNRIPVT
ncbi:hypothetical protein KGM_206364 [Danaus plexippus plexippus]|uniref:Uncharacterized protein n=1 Tax=Danaus plexippus plexippus TaxID=278856 RepID=A0A212FEC5_DANPL|nr:hypothetical protein KGM_206364 [Danaus plexippus plexippus]